MTIFTEWKHLTRAFFSMKIALDREATLWNSVGIKAPASTDMEVKHGLRKYSVTVAEHRAAVSNEHPLCAMALNLSYSLTESYARELLNVEMLEGGIETWASKLLKRVARDWSSILGGKGGLIEVAVARNALAHGAEVDQTVIDRFVQAGFDCPWKLGSSIVLTFEQTQVYRDRLRSMMRICRQKKKPTESKVRRKKARTKPSPRALKRAIRQKRKMAYHQKLLATDLAPASSSGTDSTKQ